MAQIQVHDLLTAISLAIGKYPNMPLLISIAGGLLFTMFGGLFGSWHRSAADPRAGDLSRGFSLQKGGPVALHYERANAFFRSGDMDRAVESFSKALRLNPSYAEALIGRGLALREKGDYENAVADLSEALYLDPKNAKAYYYRGSILGTRGDYAGAIADFDCSLRLNPGQKRVLVAKELAMEKIAKTEW